MAIAVGLCCFVIPPGCHRASGGRHDRVVMIEAMCEGDVERDNLILHVRQGEHWRVEFARPGLSEVYIAAGAGTRVRWRAGDLPASGADKIPLFARIFGKLLSATRDAGGNTHASLSQSQSGADEEEQSTEKALAPVASVDPTSGLPTRLVGSVASTSFYWVCSLSAEEIDRAFADTNSYLRRVVADGRILEHAPANLTLFLARQKH